MPPPYYKTGPGISSSVVFGGNSASKISLFPHVHGLKCKDYLGLVIRKEFFSLGLPVRAAAAAIRSLHTQKENEPVFSPSSSSKRRRRQWNFPSPLPLFPR